MTAKSDTTTDATDHTPEAIAAMIREFATDVSDPDNWMISVPTQSFDAVKKTLDTDDVRFGTEYQGISLCYTQNHDQARIRYATSLEDWDEQALQPDTEREDSE